jgi:hypothetical protein
MIYPRLASHGYQQRCYKDLYFVGIVLYRGCFEEMQGERCANQVAKIAHMFGADGATVSWEGAGNAFTRGCGQNLGLLTSQEDVHVFL